MILAFFIKFITVKSRFLQLKFPFTLALERFNFLSPMFLAFKFRLNGFFLIIPLRLEILRLECFKIILPEDIFPFLTGFISFITSITASIPPISIF